MNTIDQQEDQLAAPPRELTAAEKRAARRARVLDGGERRLKLLTGEIGSLKAEKESADDAVEQAMDAGVDELLNATELTTESQDPAEKETDDNEAASSEVKFPVRIDPAQRRRDAQARRQKKEAMVEQLLNGGSSAVASSEETAAVSTSQGDADTMAQAGTGLSVSPAKPTATKKAEPTFSRHTIALRLQAAEEKLILVVILGAAIYFAMTTDLRNVTTDILTSDPRFVSYRELFANGVPIDSIRQQMQRENLDLSLMQQMERIFLSQRKGDATGTSAASSGFFAALFDLPGFFTSLLFHPPLIVCVLLVRVVVGLIGSTAHSMLKLPDVKNPQEDDLGFVANLALSSRPMLKTYAVKARKSVDDLFFFLWSFILAVAIRFVAVAHHQ